MAMSDEEVRLLSRKLDRILDILNNDDHTGEKGLVAKVADLNDRFGAFVTKYNIDHAVRKRDMRWLSAIWGAVAAGAVMVAKAILAVLFK